MSTSCRGVWSGFVACDLASTDSVSWLELGIAFPLARSTLLRRDIKYLSAHVATHFKHRDSLYITSKRKEKFKWPISESYSNLLDVQIVKRRRQESDGLFSTLTDITFSFIRTTKVTINAINAANVSANNAAKADMAAVLVSIVIRVRVRRRRTVYIALHVV